MARRDENVMRVDIDPDALVEILTSEEYHVERERSKGALEVRIEQGLRSEQRHRFEVHTVVHARGLTGVDTSKRESQRLVYDWDLQARRGSWTFSSSHGDRVKVWGSVRVERDGRGSRLVNDFNIEVSIPLVGGQVEKKVMSEVRKGWAQYERTVRDFCKRR
jgi:hypothetical protein